MIQHAEGCFNVAKLRPEEELHTTARLVVRQLGRADGQIVLLSCGTTRSACERACGYVDKDGRGDRRAGGCA